MDLGDEQGISSIFRCSSENETTELFRGFLMAPATVSIEGISMAQGAPSLRFDSVVLGSTFSSSAMLGRRRVALAKREVGGEVTLLLPLFGDMVGDFAGLEPCWSVLRSMIRCTSSRTSRTCDHHS
jgi:hypothetical protein